MSKAKEILSKPAGARNWKVDLHVHTPGSRDTHASSRGRGPADVVAVAVGNGINVVAITDHNSVEWCDPVIAAATGTDLIILPGVEISTREGHLLGIFNPDKPINELREFLVTQGIREADFGNLDIIANGGIDDVARAVVAEGGIAIAAHVSAAKGFFSMAQAGARRMRFIHVMPLLHSRLTTRSSSATSSMAERAGTPVRWRACRDRTAGLKPGKPIVSRG